MLFNYQSIDREGSVKISAIDAPNLETAINALQRRGFVITKIVPAGAGQGFFGARFTFFERIKTKDIVLLSRQMATLFGAQVSALRIFRLLGAETGNAALRRHLMEVAEDIQSGLSISKALSRHPKIFSDFYVNMVKAGEESGKLDQTFEYLADNLEKTYAVTSKAKNALIYPIFVILTFIGVMALMLTVVIPKLSGVLLESGQEIPVYTKAVLALSGFLVHYGLFFLFTLLIGGFFFWRWSKTPAGQFSMARFKISVPYVGNLFRKLCCARIASNLHTMLLSAIPILKALEITAGVVGNQVFEEVLRKSVESVKSGNSLSASFSEHPEIPGIMVAMIRVGEETGEMGEILQPLARFYEREVSEAVDTLVSLIEPILIVSLGLGVAFLLASVLIPIYNISAGV